MAINDQAGFETQFGLGYTVGWSEGRHRRIGGRDQSRAPRSPKPTFALRRRSRSLCEKLPERKQVVQGRSESGSAGRASSLIDVPRMMTRCGLPSAAMSVETSPSTTNMSAA